MKNDENEQVKISHKSDVQFSPLKLFYFSFWLRFTAPLLISNHRFSDCQIYFSCSKVMIIFTHLFPRFQLYTRRVYNVYVTAQIIISSLHTKNEILPT